jgi:hypothetical protein
MNGPADLREQLDALAASGRAGRAAGWSGSVALVVDGADWVTCTVDAALVQVRPAGTAAATTIRARSADAVRRWLVDGVDYTHLVASGDFVIDGVSFDVLLLSKVLGLRPDRKVAATR